MATGSQDSNGFPGSLATKAVPILADSIEILDSVDGLPKLTTLNNLPFAPSFPGGILPLNLGGTNKALVADNGGIVYSDADSFEILAHTTVANRMLRSGNAAAPNWSTTVWPDTAAINTLLYASAADVISSLATANNGLLVTSNTGVPSILAGSGVGNNILLSQAAAAPIWSTAVYPATTTINQILFSSAANTITGIAAANDGVLVTSNTGVPSILAGPGADNRLLMSQSALAPIWSTATYPATTTINQLLYSSAANTIAGLATANSSILATSGAGVPSFTQALPTAVQVAVQSLNSGTAASSTTFWRGDGTWATVASGGGITAATAYGISLLFGR